MFKVNQKVVCLSDGQTFDKSGSVTEGNIYMISGQDNIDGIDLITLKETGICLWIPYRFAPVEDRFAENLLEEISREINEEQLIYV